MRINGFCVAALLIGTMPQGSVAQSTEAAAAAAQPIRQAALREAMAAIGRPEALRAAQYLHAEQTGTTFPSEQARSPDDLVANAGRVYRWYFDRSGKRALRESEQLFPGGIRFWNRAAVTPEGGWSIDVAKWRDGTDLQTLTAASAVATLAQFERFLPHLMLAQAQEPNAGVEPAEGGFRYKDAAGSLIQVTLDSRTQLPVRAAQIVDGRPATEIVYSDYQRRQGVMMPRRVQFYQGAILREDLKLGTTRIGKVEEARFTPPAGYTAPPPAGEPSAREIAPGLFLFENMQGAYHSMAVDQGDHLVLLEAPLSPAYAEAQKKILEKLRPGKRVSHVLVTHHHGDHGGGLKNWAEWGATIVAAKGATAALQRQLKARGLSGPAKIEEVDGRRSFGAGASRIDAYAFASSHAEAHLLMHMPVPKILFQGDMFYLPARGPVPAAFPIVTDMVNQIEALKLDVGTVVGVHGRAGTMAEVRESVRKGRTRSR